MEYTFEQIILDLREAKFTDAQIARVCGCTRQHIGNIAKGNVFAVSYHIGSKLKKLHEVIQ